MNEIKDTYLTIIQLPKNEKILIYQFLKRLKKSKIENSGKKKGLPNR